MAQYTVQVDEAVAQTIQEIAKRLKIPESEAAARILADHHEELSRFPDGVLRDGCQKIISLLGQIPCLSRFKWSGVDFRYWWVSFEIDETSPIATQVVRRLAYSLNTESGEMMLPVIFKPVPEEASGSHMKWEIASTAARLDPAGVEKWLRDQLPQPISAEGAWLRPDEENIPDEPEIPSKRRLPELESCDHVGQKHQWFNLDGVRSACYHCRVVKDGQLWKK